MRFVALDFETAEYARDSACELALVRIEDGRVTGEDAFLIRPPSRRFVFTSLHGIDWAMVADAPSFAEVMPRIDALCEGVDFLAAHNAGFDRSVMAACCARYAIPAPAAPYLCTVKLARAVWNIYPTKLDNVCDALEIGLERHHRAGFDAQACAEIVTKAVAKVGPDRFAERYAPAATLAPRRAAPKR